MNLDRSISLFITSGFGIPLDSIANGKLVLDLGMDVSLTPIPNFGYFENPFPFAIFFAFLDAIISPVKVNVGVGYAAGF